MKKKLEEVLKLDEDLEKLKEEARDSFFNEGSDSKYFSIFIKEIMENSLFFRENLQKEAAKKLYSNLLNRGHLINSAGWYISNEQALAFEQLLFDAEESKNSNISKELHLLKQVFKNNSNKIHLKSRTNIVDLGCGNGNKIIEILDNLPEIFVCYFPVDSSELMTQIAGINISSQGNLVKQSKTYLNKYNEVGVARHSLNAELDKFQEWRTKCYNDELAFMGKIDSYTEISKTLDKFLESPEFSSIIAKLNKIENKLDYFGIKNGGIYGSYYKTNYEIKNPNKMIKMLNEQLIERILFIKNTRKKRTLSPEKRKFFDLLMAYDEYNSLYHSMWRLKEIIDRKGRYGHFSNEKDKLSKSYRLLIELNEAAKNFNSLQPTSIHSFPSYYEREDDLPRLYKKYDYIDFIKDKPFVFVSGSLITDFEKEDFLNIMGTIEKVTSLKEKTNLVTLLGQTLGNFDSKERKNLIANIYSGLNKGDLFLTGIDLRPERLSKKVMESEENKMINQYLSHEDSDFLLSSIKLLGINHRDVKLEVSYKNNTIEACFKLVNDVKINDPNTRFIFKKGNKLNFEMPRQDIPEFDSRDIFIEEYIELKGKADLYICLENESPSIPPQYSARLVTHESKARNPGNIIKPLLCSAQWIDSRIKLPSEFYEKEIARVFKEKDPKYKLSIDSDKKEYILEFEEDVILRDSQKEPVYLKKDDKIPIVNSYKFSRKEVPSLLKKAGFKILAQEAYKGKKREEYLAVLAQK